MDRQEVRRFLTALPGLLEYATDIVSRFSWKGEQMRRAWMVVIVLGLVGLTGCASKGWVKEQISQSEANFDAKLQAADKMMRQSVDRLDGTMKANQKAVIDRLDKIGAEMTAFRRGIEVQLENHAREIELLGAKVSRGVEITRGILQKEKELLTQRLEQIDLLLEEWK